jgi:dTDP-4-dehydrorhamnose reductase
VRTSWVFGKGGKNYLSKLLELKESEIRLTNDQWSRFTYAPDLAAALLKLLGQKGLYHFANQGVATKYEFGLAIDKTKVVPVPGAYFPSKAKRPIYTAFDTSKIEQLMPIRSWREALQEYLCTS